MTISKRPRSSTKATRARSGSATPPDYEDPTTDSELETMIRRLLSTWPGTATDTGSPTPSKIRKTLTLDEDLVAEFGGEADDRQLSPTINALLRIEKIRRDQVRALGALLTRLETEDGPVDPERVRYFESLVQ